MKPQVCVTLTLLRTANATQNLPLYIVNSRMSMLDMRKKFSCVNDLYLLKSWEHRLTTRHMHGHLQGFL